MMERIWMVVFFLTDWNTSLCLPGQYHFVANSTTWDEARRHCRETFKDLATIQSAEDVNQLVNTASSFGYNNEVWIGLFSVIDWRWSDGSNGSGWEYRNWENLLDNEPDFYSFRQFCVNVGDKGRWWDDVCSIHYPFICYRGDQLDPEYVIVNLEMSWSDAQTYCREKFIDLATVRNETENNKIQRLVPVGNWAWIDLQLSGGWRLTSCASRLPFVCHDIPVMRRIVKLRIKPEVPSLELNDPAVNANILKKLQDRLKENGVSGVRLSWREQPDGKVFHQEGKQSQKKPGTKTEL
uniref:macrophage mannose receptor 1-like isoform X3 n=1 Tax=Gasterosteus aculeatus aculeatus TaxID=481459 RepID=UPI001A994398|nr:macrophage mannose receptor 1-like isoform X3 [Gasterosteus aculeatus aculeatus]